MENNEKLNNLKNDKLAKKALVDEQIIILKNKKNNILSDEEKEEFRKKDRIRNLARYYQTIAINKEFCNDCGKAYVYIKTHNMSKKHINKTRI